MATESLMRYGGAPTCESGLTLFRSAAQADLFYFFENFLKKCGKRLAKAAHMCYNSKRFWLWPHGQAVKTSPSHGENWGSIPHGATKRRRQVSCLSSFLFMKARQRAGAHPAPPHPHNMKGARNSVRLFCCRQLFTPSFCSRTWGRRRLHPARCRTAGSGRSCFWRHTPATPR